MSKWLKHKLPKREEILGNRFVRPFARHLADPSLWHLNRRSVAKGVAVGLFVGFMIPVAQTPFAAFGAVPVRGNVAAAALATFITNPFTTPAILIGAYQTGSWLLQVHHAAGRVVESTDGWVTRAAAWLADASLPTAAGLLLFSVAAAALGYAVVHLGWRLWVARRWAARLGRRRQAA